LTELKTLPGIVRNIAAECSVLGAALINGANVPTCAPVARVEDFSNPVHGELWAAMIRLSDRGAPIDLISVDAEYQSGLHYQQNISAASQLSYLSEIMSNVPSDANAIHYARLVREAAERQRLRVFATELYRSAVSAPPTELAAAMEVQASDTRIALAGPKARGGIKTSKEVARIAMAAADERFSASKSGEWQQYKERRQTGLAGVDAILCFLMAGKHYIVAARPSVGKTSLAVRIAVNIAMKKTKVGLFSTEMNSKQLYAKGTSQQFRYSALGFNQGDLSEAQANKIVPAAKWWSGLPLFIDDDQHHTISTWKASAKKMVEEYGVEILITDYMQNIKSSGSAHNDEQEKRAISNGITLFANDNEQHGVTAFSLAQLKREADDMKGNPNLNAVKGSSAFEEDADAMMFLMRETDPEAPREDQCRATLLVRKHREGPTGMAQLRFVPEFSDFEDYDAKQSNPF
jgi:replicative DNA helicase